MKTCIRLIFIHIPLVSRSTSSASSSITFNVPIHVMNLDHILTDVKRDIAMVLYVGDSKMWAGYQEITIKANTISASAQTPNTLSDANFQAATLLNSGNITAGDGAVYRVVMSAPAGWSNFDFVLTGVSGKIE